MTNEYKAMLFDKMVELVQQKYNSERERATRVHNNLRQYDNLSDNIRNIMRNNELRADAVANAMADLIMEMTGIPSWEIDAFCINDNTNVHM